MIVSFFTCDRLAKLSRCLEGYARNVRDYGYVDVEVALWDKSADARGRVEFRKPCRLLSRPTPYPKRIMLTMPGKIGDCGCDASTWFSSIIGRDEGTLARLPDFVRQGRLREIHHYGAQRAIVHSIPCTGTALGLLLLIVMALSNELSPGETAKLDTLGRRLGILAAGSTGRLPNLDNGDSLGVARTIEKSAS